MNHTYTFTIEINNFPQDKLNELDLKLSDLMSFVEAQGANYKEENEND